MPTGWDFLPGVRQALLDEAARLGEAEVPVEVSASSAADVEQAIRLSFAHTFRIVMIIGASLAALSVIMVLLLIGGRPVAWRRVLAKKIIRN